MMQAFLWGLVSTDPREIRHPAPPTLIFADFKGLAATVIAAIVYLAHDFWKFHVCFQLPSCDRLGADAQ